MTCVNSYGGQIGAFLHAHGGAELGAFLHTKFGQVLSGFSIAAVVVPGSVYNVVQDLENQDPDKLLQIRDDCVRLEQLLSNLPVTKTQEDNKHQDTLKQIQALLNSLVLGVPINKITSYDLNTVDFQVTPSRESGADQFRAQVIAAHSLCRGLVDQLHMTRDGSNEQLPLTEKVQMLEQLYSGEGIWI